MLLIGIQPKQVFATQLGIAVFTEFPQETEAAEWVKVPLEIYYSKPWFLIKNSLKTNREPVDGLWATTRVRGGFQAQTYVVYNVCLPVPG